MPPEDSVWMIDAMMNVTSHASLLLVLSLFALGSCGSTPDPVRPPVEPLILEDEELFSTPSVVEQVEQRLLSEEEQTLEVQLAQMRDALRGADAPMAAEIEPLLEELQGVSGSAEGPAFEIDSASEAELEVKLAAEIEPPMGGAESALGEVPELSSAEQVDQSLKAANEQLDDRSSSEPERDLGTLESIDSNAKAEVATLDGSVAGTTLEDPALWAKIAPETATEELPELTPENIPELGTDVSQDEVSVTAATDHEAPAFSAASIEDTIAAAVASVEVPKTPLDSDEASNMHGADGHRDGGHDQPDLSLESMENAIAAAAAAAHQERASEVGVPTGSAKGEGHGGKGHADGGEHDVPSLSIDSIEDTIAAALQVPVEEEQELSEVGAIHGDEETEHAPGEHDLSSLSIDSIEDAVAAAVVGQAQAGDEHLADALATDQHTTETEDQIVAVQNLDVAASEHHEDVPSDLESSPDSVPIVAPVPVFAFDWQAVPMVEESVATMMDETGEDRALLEGAEFAPEHMGALMDPALVSAVAIERIDETAISTAFGVSERAGLSSSYAFVEVLDPSVKILLGPLFLFDPTGNLALGSVGFMDIASVARNLMEGPDQDAAVAGLTRSSGAEFNPVVVLEDDKVVEELGLGMIWWGEQIPLEHLDSADEVQTPSVGRVRLVLESGDYVEGTLHSVEKGQYWIDGDLGRFSVRKELVSHAERLPKPGLGQQVVGLQAGDLVRAKAKNGHFEGRLISMKNGEALIETVTGMRIRLQDAEIEPLGSSGTRVVID